MSRSDQLSSDTDDWEEAGEVEMPRGTIDRLSDWVLFMTIGEVVGIARGGVAWLGVECVIVIPGE